MTLKQLVPVNCPSLTTTQRDALTPVNGDVIYNTTLGFHQVYRGAWGTLLVDPMTATGDLITRGAGVPAALPAGAAVGTAPLSTGESAGLVYGRPVSLTEANSSAGGGFSTYDRAAFIEGESAAPTSGTLNLVRIYLPYNYDCQAITFWSGATAGATLTNQWFGLFDVSGNRLRITADDVNTAWPANTAKSLILSAGGYVTTYEGFHYLGIMIAATTRPTCVAVAGLGNANIRAAETRPGRASSTGLTNPGSCPSPVTLGAANTILRYAELV